MDVVNKAACLRVLRYENCVNTLIKFRNLNATVYVIAGDKDV